MKTPLVRCLRHLIGHGVLTSLSRQVFERACQEIALKPEAVELVFDHVEPEIVSEKRK